MANTNTTSIYARFFDETSTEWTDNKEYNLMFIKAQESYWNSILTMKGSVFLNEVYDSLDIPRSSEGAVAGWIKDPNIYNTIELQIIKSGHNCFLLDFNVDPNIIEKL